MDLYILWQNYFFQWNSGQGHQKYSKSEAHLKLHPAGKVPVIEDGQKFLTQFLPLIEKQLSTHDYLTGNKLTLADICLLGCLDHAEVIEFS